MTESYRNRPEHRELEARQEMFQPRVDSVNVNDDWNVPVSPGIAVVIENVTLPKSGPASVWHFDYEEGCLVAATHQIQHRDRYHIGPTVRITERSQDDGFTPQDRTGYMRPDKDWHTNVENNMRMDIFREDFPLVWVVLDWMYRIEPRRAYLLTMDQLMTRISTIGGDMASGYAFTGVPDEETLTQIIRDHGSEMISPVDSATDAYE